MFLPARWFRFSAAFFLLAMLQSSLPAAQPWVVYDGFPGPGNGKRIVLISGDDEYRSEEALPQLGKILAKHHGFHCTVLFSVDPKTGDIAPTYHHNIPGLQALEKADLIIMALRFRDLPDDQMKYIADYVAAGKPIVALRTSTHAFNIPNGKTYSKWSFNNKEWDGGFGRQILGETWISHHGHHGHQSTRGTPAPGAEKNVILRGCEDVWGPTDVYGVRLPLPADCKPLLLGQVLAGMKPTDQPIAGPKNNPLMPIAWTKTYTAPSGAKGRVFTTTMGASTDLENEGVRRLLVNASYWCLGMESQIPARANVEIVGRYETLPFKFGGNKPGVKPADYAMH